MPTKRPINTRPIAPPAPDAAPTPAAPPTAASPVSPAASGAAAPAVAIPKPTDAAMSALSAKTSRVRSSARSIKSPWPPPSGSSWNQAPSFFIEYCFLLGSNTTFPAP